MATMNGSARPATSVTGILDSVSDVIEGGRVAPRPNPEVIARAKRRTYTGEYKQQILAEADAARGSGEIGAVPSTPWPVFFASDEVASGTQVRNAGRVGCAEARAEVEGPSTDRGESETAARQRAADGSAAQGGNRDRRSKKVAMLLGLPIAETEVS